MAELGGKPRAFGQRHVGSYPIIKKMSCSLGLGENRSCRNKSQKHKIWPRSFGVEQKSSLIFD